jgi:serine/threonine-protein kinase
MLLTRDVPFPERRTGDTSVREPPPIRERAPGLPRAVADVVDAALAIDPAQRPSAREFAAAMRASSPPGRAATG